MFAQESDVVMRAINSITNVKEEILYDYHFHYFFIIIYLRFLNLISY